MSQPSPSSNLLPERGTYFQSDTHVTPKEQVAKAPPDRHVAAAQCRLATAAFQAGQLDSAITHIEQAIDADPTNADFHNILGIIFTSTGRHVDAVTCYKEALRLRPNYAGASNNLSLTLTRIGRYEEALAAAEQAAWLVPGFVQALNHKSLAYLGLGQPEKAEEHCRKALHLQPDFAEALCNLGSALVMQARLNEGMACLQETLRLRPDLAEAHVAIADVLKMQGRFEDAIVHLRQALDVAPNLALAWCNLSEFTAQGLCRLSSAELDRVRALLVSDRPSRLDKSLLHFTLANVHDHDGDYDAAFAHYDKGAELRREWLQQSGQGFDAEAHQREIDRQLTAGDDAFFRSSHPASRDSDLPIFVVGMPRSGTTLVERILSSHSQVGAAGELPDIARMVSALRSDGEQLGEYPACLRSIDPAKFGALADRYLARLRAAGGRRSAHVVDKTLENFLHLGVIAVAFPRARVIYCRRDPLDVCMSCYCQNFRGVNYSWSLDDLGKYLMDYERLMAHWQGVLPLQMMEIHYEDLVGHQEEASRRLIAFCGLQWEDQCMAFHTNPGPVQTVSAVQVRRPIYASSIGRWRHYAKQLEPLRKMLAPQ